MKKRLKIIIPLLIVAAIICVLPLPTRVNKTLDGVIWDRDDPAAAAESVTVTVRGTYKRYIFRKAEFKGHIGISSLPKTLDENYRLNDLKFDNSAMTTLAYYNFSLSDLAIAGLLRVGGNFDSVFVWLYGGKTGAGVDGGFLTAPAKNREDGVASLKKLLPDYDSYGIAE